MIVNYSVAVGSQKYTDFIYIVELEPIRLTEELISEILEKGIFKIDFLVSKLSKSAAIYDKECGSSVQSLSRVRLFVTP